MAAMLAMGGRAHAGTTGGISGIATAWDGTRVANLRLVVTNPATGVLSVTTDRKGFFVILALPPGRYVFLGAHSDEYFFSPECVGIDVHADQVSQVHLWLGHRWSEPECGDVESRIPRGPSSTAGVAPP